MIVRLLAGTGVDGGCAGGGGVNGGGGGGGEPDSDISGEGYQKHAGLGVLLDRGPHSFAARSRGLHAAVGKVVDSRGRRLVDENTAGRQARVGETNPPDVAREHGGMQPVAGGV